MAGLKETADSIRTFLGHSWKNIRNAGIAILVCGAVILLTKEKAPETTSAAPVAVRLTVKADCEDDQKNPLLMNQYEEVTQLVREYYAGLAKDAEFVEEYTNVDIYTKLGPYKDSYIVFAYYEMKIRDIYTMVPGLGTLYVEKKDTDKDLHVVKKVKDEDVKHVVKAVAEHEDVQALITETQTKYDQAVQSDETLRQALMDLQQAYEDASKGIKPVQTKQ